MTSGARADLFLVEHGYAASRAEAQAAIRAGRVAVDGKPVLKPSQIVAKSATIAYEKPHPYVSRGALKLVAALDYFELSPAGLVCVDIGASTGGFTEVLLERGAGKVYAVDVGHGQLREKLAADRRVVSLEGVNARELTQMQIPEAMDAIVADVSFIGLKLVLPPVLKFAREGAWLVALIKPQFEVGREWIGKGGLVKDMAAQDEAVKEIVAWLSGQPGWSVVGTMDSPIAGGDGNREFLIAAKKS
ncbi:MAG: TlyA family RNA methyltransferase [Alphaproteobacteria bacterium]|nr:TlyA family RNA methyltransferase [Alphaproteobacteria bacterium]MDE2267220.1 TlyA family RNA methyltransferase [Alphaproteobacteria bacterium]